MAQSPGNVFFKQLHDLWIAPELERRRERGTLRPDFRIFRALIRLPKDRPAVVDFNDDIGWKSLLDVPEKDSLKVGDMVYWDQVRCVTNVEPPDLDGERVAFIYLFKVTKGYQWIFDFSPNDPDGNVVGLAEWRETFGPAIAATLQSGLVERSVNIDALRLEQLRRAGLWPAPALVPYPFQEITRRVVEGDLAGARAKLIAHCTPEFLSGLSNEWWDVPEFERRRAVLSDAVAAHGEGRFALSIAALVPHLEGIVTDWLIRLLPPAEQMKQRRKMEKKMEKFRDNRLLAEEKTLVFRKVVGATMAFVLEGPALANFHQWDAALDETFPNRHALSHGRHDDAMCSEESSVKLILLLDTVNSMMRETWQAV